MEGDLITKFTITDSGMALITRSVAEGKILTFTRALAGNGVHSDSPNGLVAMRGTTTKAMLIGSVSYDAVDESASVITTLTNADFLTSMIISEYGLFAKLTGDASDVLFGYKNNKDTPDVMYPAANGTQNIQRDFKCSLGSFNNLGNEGSGIDYSNSANVEKVYFKTLMNGFLGTVQTDMLNDLPDNTGKWGWADGGEIKKSDYPDLWEKVRTAVDLAVANVTSGVWEYLGSSNLKSYYGWYKGTTEDYFRKPNLMANEVYLRPSTRSAGVYQVNNIQSHNHDASSAGAGGHNHTGTADSAGGHYHTFYSGDGGRYTAGGVQSRTNRSFAVNTNTTGAHSHSFTTTTVAAHSHSITVDNAGGVETTPKNVGVKYYILLKI